MKKAKGITRRQLIKGAVVSGSLLVPGWVGRVSAQTKKEIVIAFCTPLSGPAAYAGKSAALGAELAVEEKNAKGGVGGRMFKLVVGDDASNPKEAIPFLRKALMSDRASAVTGIVASDVALAAKGLLEERKIPNIPVMGAVNELVTEGTRYTFRTTGSVYQWQIAVPQFMKSQGAKRVAMIYEDTSYGRDSAKDFLPEAKRQGLEIVAAKAHPYAETNFIPMLNELKGLEPEGVYMVSGAATNVFIVKQMAEVGMKLKVKVGVYITSLPFFADGLKDLVMGYCSWSRPTKGARVQEVERVYQSKYNRPLDILACYGYDNINVITEAAIRAKSDDPEAIRNEIAKTRYDGICGYRIEFTKNGGALKFQLYIGQWEKGDSGYRINEVWHSDVIPPTA